MTLTVESMAMALAHSDGTTFQDDVRTFLTHIGAVGWQLVPQEPTEEMKHAALSEAVCDHDCYRAMLAAAPTIGEQKE